MIEHTLPLLKGSTPGTRLELEEMGDGWWVICVLGKAFISEDKIQEYSRSTLKGVEVKLVLGEPE